MTETVIDSTTEVTDDDQDLNMVDIPDSGVEPDENAFLSGFHEVRDDTEALAELEKGATEAPKTDTETKPDAPGEETKPAADEDAPVNLTQSQYSELIARLDAADALKDDFLQTRDKIHGKLGEYGRTLQTLSTATQGGGVQFDTEKMSRLRDIDPDFAEAIAGDLSEALSGVTTPAPSLTEDQMREFVEQSNARLRTESNEALLRWAHPDYETVAQSEGFSSWYKELPAEEQMKMHKSTDGVYLSTQFSAYKGWKEKRDAESKEAEERIAAAEMPGGAASTEIPATEEDAFLAGFKSVRGGR